MPLTLRRRALADTQRPRGVRILIEELVLAGQTGVAATVAVLFVLDRQLETVRLDPALQIVGGAVLRLEPAAALVADVGAVTWAVDAAAERRIDRKTNV